jgi:uncharacterized protein YabN with tetrapyrrole methylase and pyrophosphatase domain
VFKLTLIKKEENENVSNHKSTVTTPDVIIAGTGIKGIMHMTLETKEILKHCDKVYVLHYDTSVAKYINSIGPSIVDATAYYEEGKSRNSVYEDLANDILSDAKEIKVGFVVHGHPLFIVSTSELILQKAPELGLEVEVLPSISSLDTLMVDIGEDFGFALQSYEVNYMLKINPYLNNNTPLFIFQVAVLNSYQVNKEYSHSNFTVLKDYLLKFYPANHKLKFILSSKNSLFDSDALEISLGDLDKTHIDFLEERPTLYVPPVEGEVN